MCAHKLTLGPLAMCVVTFSESVFNYKFVKVLNRIFSSNAWKSNKIERVC